MHCVMASFFSCATCAMDLRNKARLVSSYWQGLISMVMDRLSIQML